MNKTLLLLAGLALAAGSFAATPKPAAAPAQAASKPSAATSRPANAVPPITPAELRAQQRANQSRGARMGACQKESAERDLQQIERKQFLADCVNRK